MFNLLLNIQLKFKFWLLNGVSFGIVCLLVLCSVNLNYLYIVDKQKKENKETLEVVINAISKVKEMDRIILVESSSHLILKTASGKLYSGSKIDNNKINLEYLDDDSFHKQKGVLSLEHDLIGHMISNDEGWSLHRHIKSPSRMLILQKQVPSYAVIVLVLMIVLLTCSQLLISFFEKHINSLKSVMIHVKNTGDLRARVAIESLDEVGQMASAFNDMQTKYQTTVKLLAKTAHLLHQSATDLKSGALKTEKNMTFQQEETVTISDSITQLTAVANEVAKNAADMQSESEGASILTASGQAEVLTSKEVSNQLNGEISQVSSLVEQLQFDTKRIDSTTNEIQVISEQTSLLALNAAIEAARAGDSGRGFAVVADEVRALAKHASDSSEKIQELVTAIRNVTSEIINVMQRGMTTADHSVESAARTVDLFTQIKDLADSIKESNLLVASAAEEQSQTSVSVATSLVHVKEGAEKVLSNAKEVTQNAEAITALADELEKIVESMIV